MLNVKKEESSSITKKIDAGDLTTKPGWVRLSIHPTMTDEEVTFIMKSIEKLAKNHKEWSADYICNYETNDFFYKDSLFAKKIN